MSQLSQVSAVTNRNLLENRVCQSLAMKLQAFSRVSIRVIARSSVRRCILLGFWEVRHRTPRVLTREQLVRVRDMLTTGPPLARSLKTTGLSRQVIYRLKDGSTMGRGVLATRAA